MVLTPAVYAAAKAAKAKPLALSRGLRVHRERRQLCAAHLEPRQSRPLRQPRSPLWPWLKQFALPSILSIAATYAVLRFLFRKDLRGEIETKVAVSDLSDGGRYAAYGIAATAAALLLASALDIQLGAPTFAAGAATAALVLIEKEGSAMAAHARHLLGRPSACSRSFRSG